MSKKTISTDKSAKRDPNVALEIKDQNSTKGKINPMSKRCRKNLIVIIWIARKMVHYKITTSAIFLIWALVLIWKSWIAFLLGCCTCWSCSLIFIFVNWSRKCTWISFFDVYICTHLVLWLWHAKNLGLNRIITFFVFFFYLKSGNFPRSSICSWHIYASIQLLLVPFFSLSLMFEIFWMIFLISMWNVFF